MLMVMLMERPIERGAWGWAERRADWSVLCGETKDETLVLPCYDIHVQTFTAHGLSRGARAASIAHAGISVILSTPSPAAAARRHPPK